MGAIAILIIFGLMVLGTSVRTVRRTRSIFFHIGLLNVMFLLYKTHAISTTMLVSHRLLTTNLVGHVALNSTGNLWLQDVSILGLNLYKTHFSYF